MKQRPALSLLRTSASRVSGALSLACLLSGTAAASPWLQPPGQLVTQLGYVYQSAVRQYNVDRTLEAYPLNGGQVSQDTILQVRYGLAERVELEAGTSYKIIRYRADVVCLDATLKGYSCPTPTGNGSAPYPE